MTEQGNILWDWFSLYWIYPSTLRSFHWENIFFLYLIPFIPVLIIIRRLLHFRYRQKFDIALFPGEKYTSGFIQFMKLIPFGLMFLTITSILISLARPQLINKQIEQNNEGIDIMLVMDISESMQLMDFSPNRLEASKEVAIKFVKSRTSDRIGIVVFSGEAYTLCPLTTDYTLLSKFIKNINFQMINSGGTAIGDAIGTGINRLRESDSKTKIMILLSDGENTDGKLDPIMASKLAYAFNIKLYTIGIGTDGNIPFTNNEGKTEYVQSHLDEEVLRKMATIGEGMFFRAANNNTLNEIFLLIDRYEKTARISDDFKDYKDYYRIYLIWAIIFFLLWLALKNSFMNNFLED